MQVTLEKNELIIRIPVYDPPVTSKSGKTLLVASSSGIQATSVIVSGKPVQVGVNAFISKG